MTKFNLQLKQYFFIKKKHKKNADIGHCLINSCDKNFQQIMFSMPTVC